MNWELLPLSFLKSFRQLDWLTAEIKEARSLYCISSLNEKGTYIFENWLNFFKRTFLSLFSFSFSLLIKLFINYWTPRVYFVSRIATSIHFSLNDQACLIYFAIGEWRLRLFGSKNTTCANDRGSLGSILHWSSDSPAVSVVNWAKSQPRPVERIRPSSPFMVKALMICEQSQ